MTYRTLSLGLAATALLSTGCATKTYVDEQIGDLDARMDARMDAQDERITQLTATSAQAPLLKAAWMKPGAFYSHIGGWEDEYQVAQQCDKIVCDDWDTVTHRTQTLSRMYAEGLISGADIAILYDTELAMGRGEQAQRQIVGRLYSFRTVSESIAAFLCTLLLLHSMDLVIWVQAAAGWIPLVLALLLVEPPGARLNSDDHLGNMTEICRALLVRSRLLRLIVLALCVWSLTTFYAVWLLQKIWENHGIDLAHVVAVSRCDEQPLAVGEHEHALGGLELTLDVAEHELPLLGGQVQLHGLLHVVHELAQARGQPRVARTHRHA